VGALAIEAPAFRTDDFTRALRADMLELARPKNVHVDGRHLVFVRTADAVRAFDARCPHMGYPLAQGHVEEGVLRCDWHHWRFDLATGGCLTFGGVDVPAYPVRQEEGWLLVGATPSAPLVQEDRGLARVVLERGLRDGALFPTAKASAALLAQGEPAEGVAGVAAAYGAARTRGFDSSFTILVCLGRALPLLGADERALALVHAFRHLADAVRGRPERPLHPPLPRLAGEGDADVQRLRTLVDERQAAGSERILRAALEQGDERIVAEMVLGAVTDHVFVSTGHVLDESRQALRLLRWLGGRAAPGLAGSLLAGVLVDAMDGERHEEDIDWQEALPTLSALDRAIAHETPPARGEAVSQDAVEALLDGGLAETLEGIERLRQGGAGVIDLARALAWAAVERQGRFPVQNLEDWNDVHHLVTYANATDALAARYAERSPALARALMRAVYHGFGYVALTRFLNRPRARYAWESGRLPAADAGAFEEALRAHDGERAGALAAALALGGAPAADLEVPYLRAILTEDATFHLYQSADAALRLAASWPERPDARARVLSGSVRFVLAQKSQRRTLAATQNALRLLRGESLEDEGEGTAGG
jgi:nitrite reductase/ring-hydroxylating ferredoxin subunit